MAQVRLTPDIAQRLGLKVDQIKQAIDVGTMKGQKISDRIYLIDESLIPIDKTPPEQKEQIGSSSDHNPLAEAEQETKLAKAKADQAEQALRLSIAESGCKKLEEAHAKINELKKQAEDALIYANQIKAENINRMEAMVADKQEVVKLNLRIQAREKEVEAKIKDIEAREKGLAVNLKRYEDIKTELKELVVYHQQNIKPMVKTVRLIARTIYAWIEPLANTQYDFTKLYNFLCEQTDILEKYVAIINKPKPENKEPENKPD